MTLTLDLPLLTPGETARLLHTSTKTLARWADSGRLPVRIISTLGGYRRFVAADVLELRARLERGEWVRR